MPFLLRAGGPSTELLRLKDPSQWWDKRKSKINSRFPDFKRKSPKKCLGMGALHRVKDMLVEADYASKGMHKARISSGLAHHLYCEGAGLAQASFRCGVASRAQDLQESSGWHMLSLEEALTSLEQMPQPPSADITCILQKCRKIKNRTYTQRLLAYMCKSGVEAHRSFGNYLVPMLVEVGSIHDAQQVFNRLVNRNEYSWTSLITGYIECGDSRRALNLYQKMQEDSVHPSEHTFVALLKACARLKDAPRGQEIHAEIARTGLESNSFVGSTLVDMYAKCGAIEKAREVFDKLSVRDVVSWTALIAGYVEHGLGEEALNCFKRMQVEGVSPDALTFVCSLKACGNIGAIDKGQEIHADITRQGLSVRNPFVGNALVDMYGKCGMLAKAQDVFDNLPVRDVVSWTAIIAAYTQHGLGEEALNCFKQMLLEGISPNVVTFVCSLKACGSIGAISKGQELHAEIARKGLEKDIFVGSTLVDMYAKCGSPAKAREVFDKLPVRNEVTWNALISGYAKLELGEEALSCVKWMQLEGVSPKALTFICSLKACGSIGAVGKGKEIHADISKKGLLEKEPFVGNALVDMYAKCGSLAQAQEVFDKLLVRDIVSWTALITGYAHLGDSENVFCMLERMRGEGLEPDRVTFLNVLTVCSHTGLVDKGQKYFESMNKDCGVTPTIEHHTCMVDLLSRAGRLDEAVVMMKKMPFHPNVELWHTVLAACQKWGNVELGRKVFEYTVQSREQDGPSYVLMSNIYADCHVEDKEKGQGNESDRM